LSVITRSYTVRRGAGEGDVKGDYLDELFRLRRIDMEDCFDI